MISKNLQIFKFESFINLTVIKYFITIKQKSVTGLSMGWVFCWFYSIKPTTGMLVCVNPKSNTEEGQGKCRTMLASWLEHYSTADIHEGRETETHS